MFDRNLEAHVVATGYRSIHVWTKFEYEKWLPEKCRYDLTNRIDFNKRIWLEQIARRNFFQRIIPEQSQVYWDWKTMLDVRRVLPIVGSINYDTRPLGYIKKIDPELLLHDTPQQVQMVTHTLNNE
ncbi:MAG: hypothetical protein INQ03_09300 [Candidatus Heimdallarchaeota archaeon]|nr:hypothetical protein [Candidatus Heimdallarchaeota archaeon]